MWILWINYLVYQLADVSTTHSTKRKLSFIGGIIASVLFPYIISLNIAGNYTPDGHAVEVVNMDPVMHDIQGYETSPEAGARVLFNTPLILNQQHQRGNMHAIHNHAPGKSLVGPVYLNKGRRTFYMQCGFHAYMESWAMAVNNPYYAVTDDQGAFRIENVPPGTYQMVVWHPQAGPGVTRTITVGPDGATVEQVALPAPRGTRTAYRVMDNPRFGLESLGHPVEIEPLVEHQH